MDEAVHPDSGLSKGTWIGADFEQMGWHDAHVHAISVGEHEDDTLPPTRLLLDLDYIVRWVEPERRHGPFTFWVAPVTLVFNAAWDIIGQLQPEYGMLEVADLHRLPSPDTSLDPLWHVEGHNFDLRLRAADFTQYFRRAPQHVPSQHLTWSQRGGVSLAETAFA